MSKIKILFNIIFVLLVVNATQAQRFNFSLVAGLNAAQVNGDGLAGYDKLGLVAGGKTNIFFSERIDMTVEFLYSQQGSASEATFSGNNAIFNLDMDYLELPVGIEIKDWLAEGDDKYYKVRFGLGLSYGRVFRLESTQNFGETFKTDDFKFKGSIMYFLNRHVGFALRYTRSIIPLERIEEQGRTVGVIPHHISIMAQYSFL